MLLVLLVGVWVRLWVVRWVRSLKHGVVGRRAEVVRGRIDRREAACLSIRRVLSMTLAHHVREMKGHSGRFECICKHAWRVHKAVQEGPD